MGARGEFRVFYRKNTGILSEITSGNIKKKRLKIKGSVKGNKRESGLLKDSTSAI